MAAGGPVVLRGAVDAERGGLVGRLYRSWNTGVRTADDQLVLELDRPEPVAEAGGLQEVRNGAEVLGAAGDRDRGVARPQPLGGQADGGERGAAGPVHGHGVQRVPQARAQ